MRDVILQYNDGSTRYRNATLGLAANMTGLEKDGAVRFVDSFLIEKLCVRFRMYI
jgi:hypothetical protein